MATVYLAQDLKHERSVALKVLRTEFAAILGPERFLHEIRVTARLQHPHILTLIDSGAAEEFLYYVMPDVEGESLRQRLERGRQLPLEEALHVTRGVAAALDFAHQQGIVHRDIKPENILLFRGEPIVADFGIAVAVSSAGRERLTETGLSLGTPAYMSPEQSAADPNLDGRSDQYSLASVLYEMLAGETPYTGPTAQAIIAKRLTDPIPHLGTVRDVPRAVEAAITKALAKAPADRFATVADFVAALTSGIVVAPVVRRPRAAILAALALLVVAGLGAWAWRRNARTRWAREQLLPQIGQLVEQRRLVAAFRLAREAERYIPGDPALKKLEDGFLFSSTIRTTPPGAAVYMKEYTDVDGSSEYLGGTPINTKLPFGYLRWRFTKDGYHPVEGATAGLSIAFRLEPVGSLPADMVRVPGGTVELGSGPPVTLDDFLIDKYEVTNRQFKEFVDRGGYRNGAYWKEPFIRNGRALSREEAVAAFRDKTDRPGPATWEAGGYPQGEDDSPVSGVSWYEAAAYAAFVGKALPTAYHWRRAAATEGLVFSDILKLSNFSGKGPARVGSYAGLGPFGTYDMAGNVKEWCFNAAGGQRYILGGAWNEPVYMYQQEDAKSPFDRSPYNGFRLVKYLAAGPVAEAATQPIKQLTIDVRGEKPVSDEAFSIYRSLYAYDRGPLDPKVESVDETSSYWRRERITFNAAYGHERVIAYLFLPRGGAPPYQTIVYFPHSGALVRPSIEAAEMLPTEVLIKSGRALMFPVYKDTYERRTQSPTSGGPNAYRDEVILASKDFGRSLDYLEMRPDIDHNRLGFYGLSWGAALGPIMSAMDHRVKVAVLVAGGCEVGIPPEIDPINFAPRVTIPVLMINGRYDFTAPLETCQEPVFRLLGSSPGAKKHLLFDSGHVPPWIPVFRETLNWFDRYLGPVK